MIKVLQIIGSLNYGGIEAVIMNFYRNIDREKVQFDFITTSVGGRFEDEIRSLGGKIFYLPSKSRHPLKYMKQLKRVIRENNYDIAHSNANSASAYLDLYPAKKAGCKIRIAHSHNTSCLVKWQHYLFKPLLPVVLTHRFACSAPAAEWLFGTNKDCTIINNGIDFEKYAFNEDVRRNARRENNWDDLFVIGNVASFQERKNQRFLIEMMPELVKHIDNAHLALVGSGETMEELRMLAKTLGVSERVSIMGNRNDVDKLLTAFDAFCFPSIFEGLSVAYIEAAANGLPVIISDGVPIIKISDKVTQLPLVREQWINCIVKISNSSYDRLLTKDEIAASGYDIKEVADTLTKFYEKVIEKKL